MSMTAKVSILREVSKGGRVEIDHHFGDTCFVRLSTVMQNNEFHVEAISEVLKCFLEELN
jgi:hypothetical protein